MNEKRTAKKPPAASSSGSAGNPMDVGLLEQLVKLMSANDLNTIAVRDGDRRVVLKRGAVAAAPIYAPQYASAPAPVPAPAGGPTSVGPSSTPAPASDDANLVAIKSPMVGTFYTSSSPDAKAFVSVGSTVDEDTDVCIIEAMKVFNNIKAETRGTIAKIAVTNGQTVEFGQTLFLVKP
ncbi:MAG TPA: acetyl-CoA carboxylase biotin carboxyl carrier protein [Tepidisphaeraceae bacterium]|nr:acetyl-CoA carboxylase biotin carboxyl carrier protein [Tepidisphaeraceae bacterium]